MIELYTDGASMGLSGPSGLGFVAKNKQFCLEGYRYMPRLTNHEAEFHALLFALEALPLDTNGEILSIRSDSKVLVDTIEKAYTKNPHFLTIYQAIERHLDSYAHVFIKWIPDMKNKRADQLARLGLHTKSEKITSCS